MAAERNKQAIFIHLPKIKRQASTRIRGFQLCGSIKKDSYPL